MKALWHTLQFGQYAYVVEADIYGFFYSIDRAQLQAVIRQRVNDGRIRRLIGKWLRADVMEAGMMSDPETGVVQGGVISPVLATSSCIMSWMNGSDVMDAHG